MNKLIHWWGRGVFFSVWVSIVFLGIGRIELPFAGARFSAWSVSRTAFFFWLIWKALIWAQRGRKHSEFEVKSLSIPLIVFFGLVTASLLPDFHDAGDYRYLVFGFMHYFMVSDLFSEFKKRQVFLLLALSPGMLVIRGLWHNPGVLNFSQMIRFDYPLDHPNTAGYIFSMSIPLAWAVVASEPGWLRNLGAASLCLQGPGLVLTYSRGSWLGAAASMLFLAVVTKSYKQIALVAILGSAVLFFSPSLRHRVFTLAHPLDDGPINERVHVMKNAFKLGLKHPVLGIGYGRGRLRENLRAAYVGTDYEKLPVWHAHDVYVEVFAETGVLGLGAFLWLLWNPFYQMLRRAYQREETRNRIILLGMLAAWIAFAVTGLGDVPFYHHETRIFFFTLLALIHLYLQDAASNPQPEKL